MKQLRERNTWICLLLAALVLAAGIYSEGAQVRAFCDRVRFFADFTQQFSDPLPDRIEQMAKPVAQLEYVKETSGVRAIIQEPGRGETHNSDREHIRLLLTFFALLLAFCLRAPLTRETISLWRKETYSLEAIRRYIHRLDGRKRI